MAYPENLQVISNGKKLDCSTDTANRYHFSYFCFAI